LGSFEQRCDLMAMEYNFIENMMAGDLKASSDWNGPSCASACKAPPSITGYPKEGFQFWSDDVMVLKEAKNVENAKLFMNFIMDPEDAAMLSAFHRYANAIEGSDKFMPEDMKTAPKSSCWRNSRRMAKSFGSARPRCRKIHTRIWTDLQK
jgi:spermidine/putrescine transport system substrate-binding protein